MFQTLNVRLTFIEAIDYLYKDEDVFGCVCPTSNTPCVIILNDKKEIEIFQNNIFNEENKIKTLLTIDNVLNDDFYLIIKKPN